MAFELAWQPRLGVQFFQEEEERVEKFCLHNLSLKQLKKIYSTNLIVREDFLALNYKEAYNEISAVIKKAVL